MHIQLPSDIEQFIHAQVTGGSYDSPAALVSDAVRRLIQEQAKPWTLDSLRKAVGKGVMEADRGEFVHQTMQEIYQEWEIEYSNPH